MLRTFLIIWCLSIGIPALIIYAVLSLFSGSKKLGVTRRILFSLLVYFMLGVVAFLITFVLDPRGGFQDKSAFNIVVMLFYILSWPLYTFNYFFNISA